MSLLRVSDGTGPYSVPALGQATGLFLVPTPVYGQGSIFFQGFRVSDCGERAYEILASVTRGPLNPIRTGGHSNHDIMPVFLSF